MKRKEEMQVSERVGGRGSSDREKMAGSKATPKPDSDKHCRL